MRSRRREIIGWLLASGSVAIVAIAIAGHYWLHWRPNAVFCVIFYGLAIIGAAAGIRYGTQDKTDFWP